MYVIWIPEDNAGVLQHIKNLGGAYIRRDENVYEIYGIPAYQIQKMKGIFALSHPRTQVEEAFLKAVKNAYNVRHF